MRGVFSHHLVSPACYPTVYIRSFFKKAIYPLFLRKEPLQLFYRRIYAAPCFYTHPRENALPYRVNLNKFSPPSTTRLLKEVGDSPVLTPAAETIHRAVKGKALTLKRGQIAAGRRILFKDKDLNPLACKNSRTCQTAYAAAYYYDIIILHPVRHPF